MLSIQETAKSVIKGMSNETSNPFQCEHVGCDALRKTVNHWFVVLSDDTGVHIYEWDKCPAVAMKIGKHFCGIAHTINFVSKELTPHIQQDSDRESTLELKPPLTRDGKEAS